MFNKFAIRVTALAGSKAGFLFAFLLVLGWAITGPVFHFSEGWQIFINTATTVITFLMVFVLQNSQSRDTTALHLKLDELIKATKDARNELMGAEEKSIKEMKELKEEYPTVNDKEWEKIMRYFNYDDRLEP